MYIKQFTSNNLELQKLLLLPKRKGAPVAFELEVCGRSKGSGAQTSSIFHGDLRYKWPPLLY